MTKLMEALIERLSHLPDDEQDAFATRMMADVEAFDDDGPVHDWQKQILLQRREQLRRAPDDVVPSEVVRERLRQRREATC